MYRALCRQYSANSAFQLHTTALSERCSCDDLGKLAGVRQKTGGTHTQVEIIVLSVSYGHNKCYGVDDSYMHPDESASWDPQHDSSRRWY